MTTIQHPAHPRAHSLADSAWSQDSPDICRLMGPTHGPLVVSLAPGFWDRWVVSFWDTDERWLRSDEGIWQTRGAAMCFAEDVLHWHCFRRPQRLADHICRMSFSRHAGRLLQGDIVPDIQGAPGRVQPATESLRAWFRLRFATRDERLPACVRGLAQEALLEPDALGILQDACVDLADRTPLLAPLAHDVGTCRNTVEVSRRWLMGESSPDAIYPHWPDDGSESPLPWCSLPRNSLPEQRPFRVGDRVTRWAPPGDDSRYIGPDPWPLLDDCHAVVQRPLLRRDVKISDLSAFRNWLIRLGSVEPSSCQAAMLHCPAAEANYLLLQTNGGRAIYAPVSCVCHAGGSSLTPGTRQYEERALVHLHGSSMTYVWI